MFTRISIQYDTTTDVLKYSYFTHIILEWNKLDVQFRISKSLLFFKYSLLKIGQPTANPTYKIHNHIGLKFFTSLRLGLSHLNKHEFKNNFKDSAHLLC